MARDNPYDDDYDGKPGGRGLSPEFAQKYDPQGEQEYTNQPLNAAQLSLQRAEQEREDAAEDYAGQLAEMRSSANARIQFWPHVGKFIIPRENSFAAHLQLVQGGRNVDLHFDPATYKFFDRIIAETAQRPEIFEPSHPSYAHYAPLRDNLAVLRNDVMGMYMDDGSFDPGDEKHIPQIVSIANEIGQAINNEHRRLPRLFAPHLNTDLLNMEGDGAAYAYRHLRSRQRGAGLLSGLINDIRQWMGMPLREWNLPPVQYTPFSEDGLNAEAPPDVLCMTQDQLTRYCHLLKQPAQLAVAKFDQGRQEMPPVENNLSQVQKRETIDHGITILRWFKDIEFSDKSVMELMDTGTPEEKAEMVGVVAKFVQYYTQITQRALKRDPNLANNPQIQEANAVAKVLEHSIELLAKLEKPISLAQTQQIGSDATRQPEKWGELGHETVDRLMQTLKGGLETAVSAFDQQQHDMDQQEEQAEQSVESALAGSDLARRKRRRKRQQASGLGGKKQQKVDQSIRADDYVLGQGAFANTGGVRQRQEQGQENFREGLQMRELALKDMEIIRSLGKTLAQNGNANPPKDGPDGKDKDGKEGGGLSGLSMRDVSPNDKLAPDEKDVASRIIDARKREQGQGAKNRPNK